ncbi:DUF1828 domain-containing protein [Lactobacillus sp. W8093]|uniref:DUF1828 domain-containing protein n=1 Tax=Lactobacillus sp. W8093 TaxID=2751038 RepID=UPI0018EF9E97|nr:DUF1828 domain-containing protein [Lactobacillus sp. W8093]MBI0110739.1 DUF1828 domain-containing protein [Lactobacillus sp. W8093]
MNNKNSLYNEENDFSNKLLYKYSYIKEGIVRIDTPYLDNFNDGIVIYGIQEKNKIIKFTDDGWTLSNLEEMGINLEEQNLNDKDYFSSYEKKLMQTNDIKLIEKSFVLEINGEFKFNEKKLLNLSDKLNLETLISPLIQIIISVYSFMSKFEK